MPKDASSESNLILDEESDNIDAKEVSFNSLETESLQEHCSQEIKSNSQSQLFGVTGNISAH